MMVVTNGLFLNENEPLKNRKISGFQRISIAKDIVFDDLHYSKII